MLSRRSLSSTPRFLSREIDERTAWASIPGSPISPISRLTLIHPPASRTYRPKTVTIRARGD